MMKSNKIILIISLVFLSILISACTSSVYASTGWHGITANADTAYLAGGTQVYSIALSTGSENWRYPAKPNAKITFYADPVLTPDGQLLAASYDKYLYSLNPATGSENWIFSDATNRLIASPLVTQDMIYQPSSDHSIYAIDLSGKKVWAQETKGPIWATPATLPDCGCIFVPSMDHTVYSYDSSTGDLKWHTEDLGGGIVGTPAVSPDGVLYVGTFGSEIIALNASDGNILWRFSTEGWVWSGPSFSNDVLYFGDLNGYFYAVNAKDGTSLWRIQPQNGIVSPAVIVDDKIYLTTEGDSLFIIGTSGDVLTSRVIGGAVYASPVISGETILVSTTGFDSLLSAMNLEANQKWTFTPAKK